MTGDLYVAPVGTLPGEDGWQEVGYASAVGPFTLTPLVEEVSLVSGPRMARSLASAAITMTIPATMRGALGLYFYGGRPATDLVPATDLTYLTPELWHPAVLHTSEDDRRLLNLAQLHALALFTPRGSTSPPRWVAIAGRLYAAGPTVARVHRLIASGLLTTRKGR